MLKVRGEPIFIALQRNVRPGITVALMNIPLSISLAVASDASPVMGCITSIWAGTICAFFGGSHYNIVGPTGALSGLLSVAAVQFGQDCLPLLAIMAGMLSMIVVSTNMDKLALLVPANTMQGFKIAVAVIIAFNQINFALGLDKVTRHSTLVENVVESLNHSSETEWQAVFMFLSFFVGHVTLWRIFPLIPWSIVMAVIGIICGYVSGIDGAISYKIRTLESRHPDLTLKLFSISTFKSDYFVPATFYQLCLSSLSISFVSVFEALISAK
jgi:SulP family sulfate permease